MNTKSGVELIAQEREEQKTKHKKTIDGDLQQWPKWELRDAAVALISPIKMKFPENMGAEQCHYMNQKPYKQRLIIAGALIAAELDRLNEIEDRQEIANVEV